MIRSLAALALFAISVLPVAQGADEPAPQRQPRSSGPGAYSVPERTNDDPWPMQRGGPGGRAVCRWRPMQTQRIREWHFSSPRPRRYERGRTVWGSPALAVVAGRPMAFVGGYDHRLHALDLLQKREAWTKITNGPIGDAPAVGIVKGEPAVFFGSSDRYVYAHHAESGLRLWSRELVEPTNTQAPAQMSAPLLHEGRLYLTCFVHDRALPRSEQRGLLFALDAQTGQVHWSMELSQGPLNAPVGATVEGEYCLYVAAKKGLLQAVAVGRERPAMRWRFQMPHEVLGTPVLCRTGERVLLFLGSKFGDLIAIDARTGRDLWRQMAGNWIDNAAAVGSVDGEPVVYAGSHDYRVYALRAGDGTELWARRLGGEVYSAPAVFDYQGRPAVAVAALDDHLYVLDGTDGRVITSYQTGEPVWDKVTKGEVLWGSPVALEAGPQTAIVHGAYSGTVYTLPVEGRVSLRTKVQSAASLWRGLLVVAAGFLLVVLPLLFILTRGADAPAPREDG